MVGPTFLQDSALGGELTGKCEMKAKIFEVVLHKLPSGKSPAIALEEQLNDFLAQHQSLQLVSAHMSTLVSPAEPNAMPRTDESSIIIFCTLFYTDHGKSDTAI